ncbi:hypothetical protein GF380_01480 [Candidatus Uhrbacteria bacterium]|nr:hypothetical protein [Candidatus Uhrbacteria bacterium]
MTFKVDYDLSPITKFLRRLRLALSKTPVAAQIFGDTAKRYEGAFNRQGSAARQWLEEEFYPPEPRGRPLEPRYTWPDGTSGHKFPTPKAQAYFFWALATGRIRVPYKRTLNLRDSTRAQVSDVRDDGFSLLVSVDEQQAPYARWVVGQEDQYYYHSITGWPTLRRGIVRNFDVTGGVIGDEYTDVLADYIFGRAD